MPAPLIVAVAPGSPAALAGLAPGDEVARLNGQVPRDVIEWKLLTDEPELELDVVRGGIELIVDVSKGDGEPLGVEVQSAVFDRVRTCDNHCEFCFIYQLPKGMRRSLYLKDDDYRLSFLYGNFTTLTRFTEADLERVVTERLSPLNVSIHATDPEIRSRMLRNPRGGMSLRWLRALLDHGIEVRGQIVVCPGINDGAVLDDTMAGILDRFPDLASVAVVPLGLSKFNTEPAMRLHTVASATSARCSPARRSGVSCSREPGSGSDFAGLSSQGRHATATSGSSTARRCGPRSPTCSRWGLLVVRTDPEAVKHAGLTAFVVDMHAAGVEIRPLRQMTGQAEFNEVYFNDVRIPDADLHRGRRRRLADLADDADERAGLDRRGGSRARAPLIAHSSARKGGRRTARPRDLDEVTKLWSRRRCSG